MSESQQGRGFGAARATGLGRDRGIGAFECCCHNAQKRQAATTSDELRFRSRGSADDAGTTAPLDVIQ